jgi:hypothetical protein
MTPAEFSFAAFMTCNALRIAAYVPQMVHIAKRPGAASSISYATWILFTAANGSTALYATLVLGDSALAGLHLFNTACCATVVGLAVWRRRWPVGSAQPVVSPAT